MDLGKKHLQRSLLASSIAAVAAGVMSFSASAQEESTVVEEVVVTGIRQSLENAMDIKRDSQGVVDAISAEDIGKMPDTNLAESLQRITGVSIDRQNGEGSRVTVRGFGPDYNSVTLNGRQMPAANISETNVNDSRSFDFQNLASEAVAGIEVYKSGRANLLTGGIGSSINIKTARPLDNPGQKASFGVKAVTDTTNREGSDTTPEFSGIYSNTFADDTIGVALSASFQERNSGLNTAEVSSGWNATTVDRTATGDNAWRNFAGFQNVPEDGTLVAQPQNFMYSFNDIQRTRTNAQLALQWEPVESVTATLDYTYAELDVEQQRQELSAWFNGGESGTFGDVDSDGVAGLTSYQDDNCCDVGMGAGDWGIINENKSLGFNLEWRATDALTLSMDYHDSTATGGAKDHRGTNNRVTASDYNRTNAMVDFGRDVPPLSIQRAGGGTVPLNSIVGSGVSFRNSFMDSNIEQLQFDGVFEFDESVVSSVDFGIASTKTTVRSAYGQNDGGDWGGAGDPWIDVDGNPGDDSSAEGDVDGVFDDSSFTLRDLAAEFDDISSGVNTYYYDVNFDAFSRDYVAFLMRPDGYNQQQWAHCPEGQFCAAENFTTDRTLTEELFSVYGQVNFDTEIMSKPVKLTLGLRYEETDVTSEGLSTRFTGVAWVGTNEMNLTGPVPETVRETGSYDNLLPNIDLSVELTEALVVRASFSETLSRATYSDLQAGYNFGQARPSRGGNSTVSTGNAGLLPFESTNFDLSTEFYYDDASYVSVGYYSKDVKNFIGTQVDPTPFFGLKDPTSGARFAQARGAVDNPNDLAEIRAYYSGQGWLDENSNLVNSDTYDELQFSLSYGINQEEAAIDGFELAAQHMFGESGFGVIANYTTVDGDISYDNGSQDIQFALLGLSDSYNLVGFYDKNGIQVRLAYNWRDKFLNSTTQGNNQQEPQYTEEYGQLDLNASYEVSDNLTVFAEGLNITESDMRIHGRSENMLTFFGQQGARYNLGLRYSF